MKSFAYKAIDDAGRTHRGTLDATHLEDLEQRLQRLGLSLIRATPQRTRHPGGKSLPRRDLIQLCFHLEQLARAGVPLLESLSDLRDSLPHGRLRQSVGALGESVSGGRTLSQAMEEQRAAFPEVFRSIIQVGELTGQLTTLCQRLADTLKREDELASYARRLAIYPLFMLAVIVGALTVALIFLVPQLSSLFQNLGQDLPAHTRALIAASRFATDYSLVVLAGGVALGGAGLLYTRHSPQAARQVHRALLALPLLGPVQKQIILARFASVFALMYSSGIHITDCLRACSGITPNTLMKDALQHALERINDGASLSGAFQESGLFPPLVIRMLRMGESTGALDATLGNVNYFFERDVNEAIARTQAWLEPALTLGLGMVLLWVMMSVLGPVYDLLTRIKI